MVCHEKSILTMPNQCSWDERVQLKHYVIPSFVTLKFLKSNFHIKKRHQICIYWCRPKIHQGIYVSLTEFALFISLQLKMIHQHIHRSRFEFFCYWVLLFFGKLYCIAGLRVDDWSSRPFLPGLQYLHSRIRYLFCTSHFGIPFYCGFTCVAKIL